MRASYPTYKSTSIPWLPEMPVHWDLIGLNLLFRDNKNKNKGMVESLVLSLSYGNIVRKQREENFGLIPESFETYQILEPGYIVMRLTDLQNDKRSLRVGYVKERGIITSAYTGLVPGKVDSKYYYYLLHYLDIRKHFYSLGGGVRQSSDYNEIKKTKVPLPPPPEQTAIANYLDAKTEQINRFIEKKEKLIALLKEQLNSCISEAVIGRRIIQHNVNFVESKIEWIGRIPSDWQIKPFYSVFKEHFKRNDKASDFEILSLSYGKVIKRNMVDNTGLLPDSFDGYQVVENDDFVFRFTDLHNDKKSLRVGLAKIRGLITSAYLKVRPIRQVNTDYMYYLLHFYDLSKVFYSLGGGVRQTIGFNEIKRLPLLIPSPKEQQLIVDLIQTETTRINSLISYENSQIEKVKELKQSLIAEVVTGKIKVT